MKGEDRFGTGPPAPSRRARLATRVEHAGLDPDPTFGSVIPPIHQTSTYVQPAPGEFVDDYDYARSANPTRAALEKALGELEGGLGSAFSSGITTAVAEEYQRALGGRVTVVVIANAAHAVIVEQPHAVSDALIAYARKL